MPKEYTKEEWWKLYEKLPDELKRALFSADNSQTLSGICKRYEILDKTSEIAKYLGRVFLGILPVDEFKVILREELKFDEKLAKEVFHDINRFIFFPVKEYLTELYREPTEAGATPAKPTGTKPGEAKPTEKAAGQPKKEDVYREPIE